MSSGSLEWGRLNSSGVFSLHLPAFDSVNYETFIPVFLKCRGSMAGWVMAGIGEGLFFFFSCFLPFTLSRCYFLFLFFFSFWSKMQFLHGGLFCERRCKNSAFMDASLAKEGK